MKIYCNFYFDGMTLTFVYFLSHESASGYYRISVYFLAKVVCDLIPMRLVPITAFSAIVYFMTGIIHSYHL